MNEAHEQLAPIRRDDADKSSMGPVPRPDVSNERMDQAGQDDDATAPGPDLGVWFAAVWRRKVTIAALVVLGAAAAYASSFLVAPMYASRASFLPPTSSDSPMAGALASLGALAGLGGGTSRNTGDQYVSFLRSDTIADRLIERFELRRLYDAPFRQDARQELRERSAIALGRRDGIVTVEVRDHDPQRAVALVKAYLDELRQMTSTLTLTEAQQRRQFYAAQVEQTRAKLAQAQRALNATGFDGSAMRAEPKATAEAYARVRAELALAELRLQSLRRGFADDAIEVQQELSRIGGLRAELEQMSRPQGSNGTPAAYVDAYREFKYQESLLQLVSQQFELARLNESRDSGQIQMIDLPQLPERKVSPRRATFAASGLLVGLVLGLLWATVRGLRRTSRAAV